jgi:hypothetical protein
MEIAKPFVDADHLHDGIVRASTRNTHAIGKIHSGRNLFKGRGVTHQQTG